MISSYPEITLTIFFFTYKDEFSLSRLTVAIFTVGKMHYKNWHFIDLSYNNSFLMEKECEEGKCRYKDNVGPENN